MVYVVPVASGTRGRNWTPLSPSYSEVVVGTTELPCALSRPQSPMGIVKPSGESVICFIGWEQIDFYESGILKRWGNIDSRYDDSAIGR
jgi:hypothetical protein